MSHAESSIPSISLASTYFKNARLLSEQGDFIEAIKSMDTAIVLSCNSPFYIYQKIRLLFNLDYFRSCSEFIVSQLSYLYKQGSLYIFCRTLDFFQKMNHYSVDQLSKLLSCYEIPLCLADTYEEILFERKRPFYDLAHQAMDKGDYNLCLSYCELYQKAFPTHGDIVYMKAYSYHMLGQLQKALLEYLIYSKMRPNTAMASIHIAFVLMELRDYETAISFFEKANKMEPSNIDFLLYLGECYYVSKQYSLALSIYKDIEKAQPDHIQNLFNLSHTYAKLKKNHLSRRYLILISKSLKKRRDL